MASTMSNDDIKSGFPFPTLTPIVSQPTFDTINKLHFELKTNAATVRSTLGGGDHGLLGLVMSRQAYQNVSGGLQFVPPIHPGPLPPPARANATAERIAAGVRTHKEELRTFTDMENTDKILRQLIVEAVEYSFVSGAGSFETGFLNVSAWDLIKYLYDNYGKISPKQKRENKREMERDWDPAEPISVLFRRIDKCINIAELGGSPLTPQEIIDNAYLLLQKTKLFKDELKEWRRKPTADKTWANFTTFFTEAYRDIREEEMATDEPNYHSANAVINETMQDTLLELAHSVRNDHTTIAELKDSNEVIQKDISKLTSSLDKLFQKVNTIAQSQQSNNNTTRGRRKIDPESTAYCHTHGRTYDDSHTSSTCRYKKAGHNTSATLQDRKGGNNRGCGNNE